MTDEIHRAALAASIPPTIRWLDAAAVGAMLGYSARHVLQRIACRPDFPAPRNLGGHPRWKASEVDARSRFATDEVIEAAKARSIFLTAEFKRGRKAASKRLHEARKYEARPRWADVDAIASIYAECARITRVSGVPHEVDHIIPLLGRGVCGLHVEANLRIVPRHVNRRKSNKLEPVA